jgi:hypothetical protein
MQQKEAPADLGRDALRAWPGHLAHSRVISAGRREAQAGPGRLAAEIVGLAGLASGRRAPATRPGALCDLVEEHLRKFPDASFTPHQVGKVLERSAGVVANALDKLTALNTAQMITDKPSQLPSSSFAAPAPDAAADPGTSAEAMPNAA